jgi:hypothetical protein
MTTNLLNRRRFLHGLGGAVVAVPFLSSVAERAAKAQSVPVSTPKRLIVLFTHYGCLTTRWFPKKSHGVLTAADYEATTLKHLAPYASKLLMPRGIRAMNEWSFQGTLGQTTDPHTQVVGSYFTCYPVSGGKFDATPTGRSLDHYCAEQVSRSGTPLVIQIGGVVNNAMQQISYSAPQQNFPGVGNPTQLYNSLTGLFGQGTVSPDTYRVARGKSVIDVVRDDLASLKRVPMSQSDVKKLDDWAELLHQTTGMVTAQCTAATAQQLGITSASVQGAQGGGLNVDLSKISDVMMNLAVLSAVCDSNRVIFMKYPGNYTFRFLNHNNDSHGISHRGGTANMGDGCLPNVLDLIANIDDWYAQKFAYLIKQLDSIKEGDSTLLDNTATVWFQEMSDGNSHNLNNLPIIQAGSCGGYFKVGQAVNVEGGKADLSAGNSEGACGDSGRDNTFQVLDSLGTPPNVATQPINKYFCNLMNAIGVKAGADGFPAKGGTQEVTHFGKYDDSKLFNTTQPTTITSPGEYKDLRASG